MIYICFKDILKVSFTYNNDSIRESYKYYLIALK